MNLYRKRKRTWDKMVLGAVWNFWDGEETLSESVDSIRKHVDFLGVVYQEKSNFGELRTPDDMRKIKAQFKSLKLEVLHYEPKGRGTQGEIEKRNQALDLCKAFGCTHLIVMDADEVYDPEKFAQVKADIDRYDYHTTCAPMATHYKFRGCILDPKEDYYVPLIYKIDDRCFGRCQAFPVVADPARKLTTAGKHIRRVYVADEIEMQHLSFVRSDAESLARKLRNSSASVNWPDKIPFFIQQWENHKPGMPVSLPYRGTEFLRVHQTSHV